MRHSSQAALFFTTRFTLTTSSRGSSVQAPTLVGIRKGDGNEKAHDHIRWNDDGDILRDACCARTEALQGRPGYGDFLYQDQAGQVRRLHEVAGRALQDADGSEQESRAHHWVCGL